MHECLYFHCFVQVGHLYVTPVGVKSSSHGNQQPSAAAPLEKLDNPQEAEGEKISLFLHYTHRKSGNYYILFS